MNAVYYTKNQGEDDREGGFIALLVKVNTAIVSHIQSLVNQ